MTTFRSLAISAVSAGMLFSGMVTAQTARDYISIVGSSTVYPFATVVAERFGKTTAFKTPKIEATGSGGGLKLFCDGVGVEHPDITNASRRIKASEVESCASNGVNQIVEVKVGYDGIVMANSRRTEQAEFTLRDIFLALAKDVPDPAGGENLIPNPYITWNQVNPELPSTKIRVLGPPPTSGTRDAFVELAMEGGCNTFDWVKTMKKADKTAYKSLCHTIREDGVFVEAGENDNLIVQKLETNPSAFGVFGFSFLDQNIDKVQGSAIDGVPAEFETIADGDYPVSRALYFYVKTAHVDVIPGMREFLNEFTSEKAWGPDGYLTDRGMIPMGTEERQGFHDSIEQLTNLNLAAD